MLIQSIFYILMPGAQFVLFMMSRPDTGAAEAINFASSIFAFHWMVSNLLISSKIPVFQRHFPYDRRIRFHLLSSAGIAICVAYHAIFKTVSGYGLDPSGVVLLVLFLALTAAAVTWVSVPLFARLRAFVTRSFPSLLRFGYDRFKLLHGLLAVALSAVLAFHVLVAELFELSLNPSAVLYAVFFLSAIILFAISKTQAFNTPVTITEIREQGGILRISGDPRHPHRYRSGQFAYLKTGKSGASHPFSYTTCPAESGIGFGIRIMGNFTRELSLLKPGDTIYVNGGFGNFHPRGEGPVCLISSGIGAAPCISILKDLYAKDSQREICFHASVNVEDELPEIDTLRTMAAEMKNLKLKINVFSRDGILYSDDYFRKELPDPGRYAYYVCSSGKVRKIVTGALKSLGVRQGSIRFEAFSFGE